MKKAEMKTMLVARLKCMEREVSGVDTDCNNQRCNDCPLNYQMGTMGEQIYLLRTLIKSLDPSFKE